MRSKVFGVALLSGKWRVRRLHLNGLARLLIYFSLSLAKSYAFKYKAAPGRRNVSHLTRGAISKITGAPAAIRFFHARDRNARNPPDDIPQTEEEYAELIPSEISRCFTWRNARALAGIGLCAAS